MRKLFTAATALLVTASMTWAAVESANIVGYRTIELPNNRQIITGVSFQTVGGSALDLQDIVISGVGPTGATRLWWWDKDTFSYTEAFWVELDFDPDDPGWGDGDDWLPMEKTFGLGECFWVQAPAGASITVAGELLQSNDQYLAIELPNNRQIQVTHPMPAGEFDLQDLIVTGVGPTGATRLWWWDKDTFSYTEAFWVELDFDPDDPGWGDGDDWLPIYKTFADGEGFWIQAPEGASLLFPNPLYQAAE